MDIYSNLKDCKDEDVFDLVMLDDDLQTDGAYGLIESFKGEFPELDELHQIPSEHDKLQRIDRAIVGRKLLFVVPSNGTDSPVYKVEPESIYQLNLEKYGMSYAQNYVPVEELPDLWDTPGAGIDRAAYSYAEKITGGHSKKWWEFW
jgi:hypothetical protein